VEPDYGIEQEVERKGWTHVKREGVAGKKPRGEGLGEKSRQRKTRLAERGGNKAIKLTALAGRVTRGKVYRGRNKSGKKVHLETLLMDEGELVLYSRRRTGSQQLETSAS